MAVIDPDKELCTCMGYKLRMRAEGRIVVCDACGKPKSLPFCIDCKWYRYNENSDIPYMCIYPINKGINLVTGKEDILARRNANTFRQNEGDNCGTRARFFERRDK